MAVFRDHPRTCEYYYVIADGETRQAVGMEASWNVFTTAGLGATHRSCLMRWLTAFWSARAIDTPNSCGGRRPGFGSSTRSARRALMDRPVAMKSNLHSAAFETNTTKFWIANASSTGEPASTQPYHEFMLNDLVSHRPDSDRRPTNYRFTRRPRPLRRPSVRRNY